MRNRRKCKRFRKRRHNISCIKSSGVKREKKGKSGKEKRREPENEESRNEWVDDGKRMWELDSSSSWSTVMIIILMIRDVRVPKWLITMIITISNRLFFWNNLSASSPAAESSSPLTSRWEEKKKDRHDDDDILGNYLHLLSSLLHTATPPFLCFSWCWSS